MSERLRRLTRNQLGSARVGSNPARCELLYCAKQAVPLFCTVRFVMLVYLRAHFFTKVIGNTRNLIESHVRNSTKECFYLCIVTTGCIYTEVVNEINGRYKCSTFKNDVSLKDRSRWGDVYSYSKKPRAYLCQTKLVFTSPPKIRDQGTVLSDCVGESIFVFVDSELNRYYSTDSKYKRLQPIEE
uniref:Apple domain-containing protein n=1 Tax=Heterorhabditis bacteriophora TaxID=37862 RepID=A0A1I7WCQ4_HETBA